MANISTDFSTWSGTAGSNQPDSGDTATVQADLQAIQAALRTIFPSVNAAVTPTHTELNYVDGVTSAIQTQLDGKAALAGGTFSGDISVPDEVYGAGWNGSVEVPTKNAVYDKIESISQTTAISQLNTSVSVTDTGTDGKITHTVDGVVISEETDISRKSTIDGGSTLYPLFGVRAFACVTISGGVPTLAAGGNIDSLTDNGVGNISLTFGTAMPDANYAVAVWGKYNTASAAALVCGNSTSTKSTTSLQLLLANSGTSTLIDFDEFTVIIVR